MTTRSLMMLLAVAACGGTDPETLDLSGTWSGATDNGTAVTLKLSHDLSTDRLSGTWSVGFGSVSLSGTADGHLSSGSVTLVMHFESSAYPIRYTGAVATGGASMRGTITWDPGDTQPLNFTKDPQ